MEFLEGPAALIVGHPGHELRVHGWMEQARPLTFVLTDGSGSRNEARIESTTCLLQQIGARRGSVYGRFTDRQIYDALLREDHVLFLGLAVEIGRELREAGIRAVVCDAREGYNPSHDACRLLAWTAAAVGGVSPCSCFDFPLVGPPNLCPDPLRARAIWLNLDEEALHRKVAAACGYPELAAEVEKALSTLGPRAFQVECLRPAVELDPEHDRVEIPFYESYGEKQVAAGIYQQVIRYREHLAPLAAALARLGEAVAA
jgi:hypothetical protein